MNPTLHYLIKETALRWRTRPSSPLARAVLTFTLAATAGGFLVGFSASAKALRLQLARFGFETLAIRIIGAENATSPTTAISPDHWAAPLAPDGQVIILQQAPILPTTPWGHTATVFVTPWPVLAGLSRSVQSPPAILLTNDWPAGKTMPFTLRDGTEISAVALPAEGPWKTLIEGDALLIPPEFVPAPPPKGAVEVVLFTPKNPENLESWVTAIKRHFAAENRPLPVLQDPSPLRKALAELERGQSLWRRAILGLLGTGVILIFTAIGILEQQEMRFAQALLRSLGIPRCVLWLANLV
ncbi:MAG: hypothetical protein EBS01_14965, partial [Verrucomicrobia bacterium]|nr:hypothetical protein [Verrucomicrobiota bacterium]